MGQVERYSRCSTCRDIGDWEESYKLRRIDSNFMAQWRILKCKRCKNVVEQRVDPDEKVWQPE